MLDMITGAFGAIAGGGATGLLGAVISRFADYKLEKMRFSHQRELADLELKQIKLEAEYAFKVADREATMAEEVAASETLRTSYSADSATYLRHATGKVSSFFMGVVDFARGMLRPGATVFLLYVTYSISREMHALVTELNGAALDANLAQSLWVDVVNMILYLTSAAVLWWFGARPKAKG